MIAIEEVPLDEIGVFWNAHLEYLIGDGLISGEEEISYFSSEDYRGVIEQHIVRETDKHKPVYFSENGKRIGACSYCIYQSEDGKCFILDFWVFPQFRGNGTGHRCFQALEARTRADGATYYELNCGKENAIRFWKSNGFAEKGRDEYGDRLFIKRPI